MGNCNCCSCCCCGSSGGGGGHTGLPGGFGGATPAGPRLCNKYQVTFVSIDVHKVSDGVFDNTLEATFHFSVNHESETWKKDLKKGRTEINRTIYADVPSEKSSLLIQVSGKEKDLIKDDKLAGFSKTFGQLENWGVGAQSESASNGSIGYTLNYKIECATQRTAAVPPSALMQMAEEKEAQRDEARMRAERDKMRQMLGELKQMGVESKTVAESGSASLELKSARPPMSQAQLLSMSLDRFKREGWEVVQMNDNEIVFSGYGDFPEIVNNWHQHEMSNKKGK